MSRKYRVEQKFTTGWGLVSETSFKLSKDEAKKTLEILMSEGVNPDDVRAIPDECTNPKSMITSDGLPHLVWFTKDGCTLNVTLHPKREGFPRQSIISQ